MQTNDAINKAGSRAALAKLLGVSIKTTYHWIEVLPKKHEYLLRLNHPTWFKGEKK